MKGTGWKLAFKAVAGVSDPDTYKLWISTDQNSKLLSSYATTCQLTPTSPKTHCKVYDILNWDKLKVKEVSSIIFELQH